MNSRIFAAIIAILPIVIALPATADGITVTFTKPGKDGTLPPANASCIAAGGKAADGDNKSPALTWSAGPAGAKSYALTMTDPDVPADLSLLNMEGVTIPEDAPRMTFTHWVLADIPAARTGLREGEDGDGLVKGGLPLVMTDHGRRGQNGFAAFLKDGPHGGYMGACPPWNDDRIHRYRVTVYALDTDHLDLPQAFTHDDLMAAAKGHIVSSGTAELTYTIKAGPRE